MNPRKNMNYGPEVVDASSADRDFFQTLPEHKDNPVALRYQKALVRKVLDETLDFDNVIYSLGNECPSPSVWNEFWVAFIRSHAANRSARRVFVTNMWRHDLPVFDVFDIQDAHHPYRVRRMNAAGMWNAYRAVYTRQREQDRIKPVYDSGQMGGAPGSHILHQLWMSFVGGTAGMRYHRLAPVHPRPGISSEVDHANWQDPFYLEQQRWIHHLRRFIEGLGFWTMQPLWDAVVEGQGYAFGRPGDEYVVYLPGGGSIALTVPSEPDLYEFYWYDSDSGKAHPPGTVDTVRVRDSVITLTAPSKGDWVLHLGRHKLRPPAADRLLP